MSVEDKRSLPILRGLSFFVSRSVYSEALILLYVMNSFGVVKSSRFFDPFLMKIMLNGLIDLGRYGSLRSCIDLDAFNRSFVTGRAFLSSRDALSSSVSFYSSLALLVGPTSLVNAALCKTRLWISDRLSLIHI